MATFQICLVLFVVANSGSEQALLGQNSAQSKQRAAGDGSRRMVEHKVYIASAARNLYALGGGRHKAQRAILHALLRHVDGRFHKWQQAFHNVAQHTACKVV